MNPPVRRALADRLRAIPLREVLRALDAQPEARDPAKWRTPRGLLSVNGSQFFNWNLHTGGGGAIDLAIHLTGQTFAQTLDWLASHFALSGSMAPTPAPSRLLLPAAVPDAWPTVLGYLCTQRRLPLPQLQALCRSGKLYADRYRNAVFLLRNPHQEPVGAELRGTSTTSWRGMAPGTRKDNGYFAVGHPSPKAIVLCESAIDVISCHILQPTCLCISTAGARDHPAWLPDLLARNIPTCCGFDADPTGDRFALAMIQRYPVIRRLRPPHHDWNDTLRALA